MSILILWVKKLILLVLLATFLELLLPDNAYQKYVRLSMGLLILLTLLTPLLEIFQTPITLDQLSNFYQEKTSQQGLDLERIQGLSKQLVAYQDETTTQYVQTQMKDLVKQQVEEQYQVQVETVDVKLKKDKENKPIIDQILVTLQQKTTQDKATSGGGGSGAMSPIKPMDPVNVAIDLQKVPDKTQSPSVPVMEQQSPQLKKIASGVATAWNLTEQQVNVKWNQRGEGK